MDEQETLARKLASILPQLNERQRRLVLAAEARALGGSTAATFVAKVWSTSIDADYHAPSRSLGVFRLFCSEPLCHSQRS
jgi:hypothetical protein